MLREGESGKTKRERKKIKQNQNVNESLLSNEEGEVGS